MDFAFLATQTFGDEVLEREVLELFVTQTQKILRQLPILTPKEQTDTGHLLKGSARGIGAWTAADIAERYEAATPETRPLVFRDLERAFEAAGHAIAARLTAL